MLLTLVFAFLWAFSLPLLNLELEMSTPMVNKSIIAINGKVLLIILGQALLQYFLKPPSSWGYILYVSVYFGTYRCFYNYDFCCLAFYFVLVYCVLECARAERKHLMAFRLWGINA